MAGAPSEQHGATPSPPPLLAIDTQGLRTDRLLHVRVFAESTAGGDARDASVMVTKGRFSENKRRFIERSETFALRAGAPVHGSVNNVLTCNQVLDDTTGRLCTCFLVSGETGKNGSLALCRLLEGDADDAQREDGGGSGRRSQHVVWQALEGELKPLLGAVVCTIVPGPCVLAWRPAFKNSEQARVHCWYRGEWHVYVLRTTGENGTGCISFEGTSTLKEGGHLFRMTSSSAPSTFAWSVLDLPPPSSSSHSHSSSSSILEPMAHCKRTHLSACPYPWLPASMLTSVHRISEPLAICIEADGTSSSSEIYVTTSTELAFLSSTHQHPQEPVCRVPLLKYASSQPTQICAFLARRESDEDDGSSTAVIEHVGVLFGDVGPLHRLLLLARRWSDDAAGGHEQELQMLREFHGIGGILRGDFSGSGWDEVALLPPRSTSSSSSSPMSTGMAEVALTDFVHVWAHKGCCMLGDAPDEPLGDRAGFRSADKARRRAAAAAAAAVPAAAAAAVTTIENKKRPLSEQPLKEKNEQEEGIGGGVAAAVPAAGGGVAAPSAIAVAESKERVLGKIQEALRERLRDEEAEQRRLGRVEEQKQVLLLESQGVLTSMAYQEVLPVAPIPLEAGGGGGGGGGGGALSFASSLRPVLASDNNNNDDINNTGTGLSETSPSRPLLPIASHRILHRHVDAHGQRLALDVALRLCDNTTRLRLEDLSLAVVSQHGPVTFTSSTIRDSAACASANEAEEEGRGGGEGGEGLRLQISFSVSMAAFLDPLTWTGEVTLCCVWRRMSWKKEEEGNDGEEEEEEEEVAYPPGAQPLQQLAISARDFLALPTPDANSCSSESSLDDLRVSNSLPLLWKLDAALLPPPSRPPPIFFPLSSCLATARLDPTQHTCHLAAIDLPTLCMALHQITHLQQNQDHGGASASSASSPICSLVPLAFVQPASSFVQGLASTVALLQQELDLLCTLVEGGVPDEGTIRDVWLSQPALDVAVYVLANLCILSTE